MAGTKHPAEAMGFVLSSFLRSSAPGRSPSEEKRKNESVGERSALGEAEMEIFVDSAEARISQLFSIKWVICKEKRDHF